MKTILPLILMLLATTAHADDTLWQQIMYQGKPLEGVKITIKIFFCNEDNSDSILVKTTQTGSDGKWFIGGLMAGNYLITPEKEGFRFEPAMAVVKLTGKGK